MRLRRKRNKIDLEAVTVLILNENDLILLSMDLLTLAAMPKKKDLLEYSGPVKMKLVPTWEFHFGGN